MQEPTDPRKLGGKIVGDFGDPHSEGSVVIDTRNAVLFDHLAVARLDGHSEPTGAIQISGRINKTDQRVELLLLANGDGLAAIVSEIVDLCRRDANDLAADFAAAIQDRRSQ